MPKISPRRSSKLASRSRGGAARPRTESTTSPLDAALACGKQPLRRTADHLAISSSFVVPAMSPVPTLRAVAQHGVAIGDLAHFLEEVADVDDRDAARREPADEREQPLDVGALEAARRLVHQQHARIAGERATDLDDLACRQRQIAEPLVGMNLRMRQLVEQRARARARRGAVDPSASRRPRRRAARSR